MELHPNKIKIPGTDQEMEGKTVHPKGELNFPMMISHSVVSMTNGDFH